MSTSNPPAPTERQLRYLRALAARTATTFVTPTTRADASREIGRLRGLDRAAPIERRHDDDEGSFGYATAVEEDEVTGFGSSARWRRASATPVRLARPGADGGRPDAQLARYSISTGERALHAEPRGPTVRIVDRPVGAGRAYVVEERLERDGCAALVADYLKQAQELDVVPMAGGAVAELLGGRADV